MPQRPTHRDLASFWEYALRWKLVHPKMVIEWADSIIEATDNPPAWCIDIAMGEEWEMPLLLHAVPGSPDRRWVANILLAFVRRELLAGRQDVRSIGTIGSELLAEGDIPESEDWPFDFELQVLDVKHGLGREEDLERILCNHLLRYVEFEPDIPAVLRNR